MKKIAVIHPKISNEIQKRALETLTSFLLDYTLEYPVCFSAADGIDASCFRCIYIGTKENNGYILKNSRADLTRAEEYCIKAENDTVIIEGADDAGVLYGAIDFYNRYILRFEYPNDPNVYRVNFFERERIPDFEYVSSPSVKERGLWTWGHVIYDYKGYIDNMMLLKLNRLIIWNDFLPANASDIIEYAHARNIKVIWGFAWLWDTNCAAFDMASASENSRGVFEKFEKEFADIEVDGIYFQTFTELRDESVNGVIVAEAAAKFVNDTAKLFYEKYPKMEIQFGLHAGAVKNRLEFIKTVDPRIRIVWENCGSFPFSYIPCDVADFEDTADFVGKIAVLRGKDDRFGAVTKGLVKLDWGSFEHSRGAHCIGVSTPRMKRDREARKAPIWKYIQAQWLTNADKALAAVCQMRGLKNGELCIFALAEDGMFEKNIMFPVALYAEMLWNCDASLNDIISGVAMRAYVTFA